MKKSLAHFFVPHHTNNHRAKLLQPAGLSVLVVFSLFLHAALVFIPKRNFLPYDMVLGYASSISTPQVIEATNQEREKLSLTPLKTSDVLSQAAAEKAAHMFANDYWAHISPQGVTPWYFMHKHNYNYTVAGENLARDFGDTQTMTQAWMDSPTHRENIVNPKYTEIGIAVVNGTLQGVETTLVVQMFGHPAQVAGSLPSEREAAPQTNVQVAGEQTEATDTKAQQVSVSEQNTPSARSMYISPLKAQRAIALLVVSLVFCLVVVDLAVMHRANLPRKASKNWAHVALLSFALVYIVVITQGAIL
jgi:hypothetical protein